MKKRFALFTDIHFGKKSNSMLHNQDCLDFIKFFCNEVKADGKITHVIFLGDWFENRNAVNVLTMHYSMLALKMLDALGLPIYVIVGNHDLYHRESRKIFSTGVFDQFKNVTTVSELTVIDNFLISPFLFKTEYPDLIQYNNLKYWFGHFEFRNFVVTGTDRRMDHGPDHTQFTGPDYIFSGHFHKRQIQDNVIFIGNTFPMDFGDAGDRGRGMCILDEETNKVDFIDWDDCPTYMKIRLSDILDGNFEFPPKCRVRCLINIDITYSDAQSLKEEMLQTLDLREFALEENINEKKEAIAGDDTLEDFDITSLDDAVIKMLETGVTGTTTIEPAKLIEIYSGL